MTTEPQLDDIRRYLQKLGKDGQPYCVCHSVGNRSKEPKEKWDVWIQYDAINNFKSVHHGFGFSIVICCFQEPKGCFIIPAELLGEWFVPETLTHKDNWGLSIKPESPSKIILTNAKNVGLQSNEIDVQQYFHDTSKMCDRFPNLREWITQNPPLQKSKKKVPVVNDASNNADDNQFAEIDTILAYKKQVILYGPPGTGKTYWANKYVQHKMKDVTDKEERKRRVQRCTFHPEYGYEHFIEGYRPIVENRQMGFELKSGIFKDLCGAAKKSPDHDFYLIIDEINRGDIPRIFGELITLIEADKRGKSLTLSTGKMFDVPPNVYIIATMNTADRSIALLDTALRRRFGFHELKPNSSVFGKVGLQFSVPKSGTPLAAWFDTLNKELKTALEGKRHDAEHILIGHSYFLQLKGLGSKKERSIRFTQIIQYEILPLIQDYCYENKDAYETLTTWIKSTTVALDELTLPAENDDEDEVEDDDIDNAEVAGDKQ